MQDENRENGFFEEEENLIEEPQETKDDAEEKQKKSSISADLIRGHINTIILRSLYEGDRYGYDIISEIEQKSHGQYTLKQPTLYSALKRLESQGYVKSYWGGVSNGGRRRYFSLTDEGRAVAEKNQAEWEYSRTIIDSLISQNDFDFSQPAPEKLDFRILRKATSRTPIVGEDEEDIPPYTSVIASASQNEESDLIQSVNENDEGPSAPYFPEEKPIIEPRPETPAEAANPLYYGTQSIQYQQQEPARPADPFARQEQPVVEQPFAPTPVQPTQPFAQQERQPVLQQPYTPPQAPSTAPVEAKTEQAEPEEENTSNESDGAIPLYLTRTEEERNYKDILARIYRSGIKEKPTIPEYPAQEAPAQQSVETVTYAEASKAEENIPPITEIPVAEPEIKYVDSKSESKRPLTPGRIDFQDIEEQAKYDGLRVWTAGGAATKKEMPKNFFNKGLALLRASLVFFCVAVLEVLATFLLKDDWGIDTRYIAVMLVAACVPPIVCAVMFFAKYQPCCKRSKNGASIYNGLVAFISAFILLIVLVLFMDVKLTDTAMVIKYIVIPCIYLFNIMIFAITYHFLSRSKS